MGAQYQNFSNGISLESKTTSTNASKGDLEVLNASGKLNYNNGTTSSPVVTEAHSSTLTNKTINGPDNTITNLTNSNLNGSAGITNANLANSSLTVNGNIVSLGGSTTITANTNNALTIGTGLQLNSGTTFDGSSAKTLSIDSSVVTLTGSQNLTNKSLNGGNVLLTTSTTLNFFKDITTYTGNPTSNVVFSINPTLVLPNIDGIYANGSYTIAFPLTGPANNTTLIHTTSGTYVWGEPNPSPKITIYDTASSGTHTTASNVKYMKVRMVGGGGNGGSGGSIGSVKVGGGGGGGGGYVEAYITSPNSSYSYTVGNVGGNSTFGTSLLTASGGSSGAAGSSSGDGGAGGGGSITATPGVTGFVSAGQGGGGGDKDDISSANTAGGVGGSSVLGGGGRGIVSSPIGGAAAGFGGGGGGGRGTTGTGGAGKNGIIIVEEYYNY